ncbi:MAG: Ig-like domain-containing protein [Planctomycetota bacterium]
MSRPPKISAKRLRYESLEPRFVLTSSAPFDPVLDLQVDSGVIFNQSNGLVSAWNDQAAGDNHLRSNGTARPTYGAVQTPTGLDAISFDGLDDRLLRDVNDGISGPPTNDKSRTMFLVAQFHDSTTIGGATYGRGALNQSFGIGVGDPGSDHGDLAFQTWPDGDNRYFESDGFTSPGNSTGWMVLTVVHERDGFDPADNNWLYRDGVEIDAWDHKLNTKLHSTLDLNGNTASRLVLGEGIKERGNIEMDVAAWLVYDDALSDADRQAVEGYLTATYVSSGANETPTATDDFAEIADGSTTAIDILANDTDSDGFLEGSTVTIVNQPSQAASFSVNPTTGMVTYTHNGSGFNDSFTYTVEDNLGGTSNVANVAIVVSSDVLPVTAGLVTLLESDAGVSLGSGTTVASWLDTSDNGLQLNASGNPQFVAGATPSGQPAIAFDGAGDKLEVEGTTVIDDLPSDAEDRTVFVVANYLDPQGVQAGVAYGKANSNRTFGVGADGPTGNLAVQGYLGNNDLVSSTLATGQGWQVQSVVLDNNNLQHFESGVLIDSWTHTYQTRVDAPTSKLVLGQSLDEAGFSELQVGAVLVYDRALTAAERQQVETYLADKYTAGQISNQPPTAVDDAYTITQGGVLDTQLASLPSVLDNDSDPNFDPLSAFVISGPSHGTLTLDTDGSFIYTHNGLTSTDDSFTYVANDGSVGSNVATVNISVTPISNDNVQIVRWHGDYYQHLWIGGIPGGSPPEIRENRWLRGGPPEGTMSDAQNLDLDNDGQFDDSRVWFDFSLTDEFNPPDTTSKVDGLIYHTEMPSARFYGGLSADFLNYETERIQQAFIENDGAGGELDDVGYPSPYLTPEFDGLSDFIELVRNDDGRNKKNHVGPHEDFAINLYRPDLPHPIDPNDDPSDNLVTFHAAFIWKKADFLAGGDTATVSLDAESSFSFESTRWWDNTDEARWILQADDGQLYISQFTAAGSLDLWGATNTFADPLSSNWAVYNPATDNLDFDHTTANWIDPVANNLFDDIQAVGLYIANDTPSGDLTKFSLDEIQFNAVLTPASVAASTTNDDGPPASALAFGPSTNQADTTEALSDQAFAGAASTPTVAESPLAAAIADESSTDLTADTDNEGVDLLDLDEAFADFYAGL